MNYTAYKTLAPYARGIQKAPLVFKGAKVLHVFTEEWLEHDIAVANGVIVGVGAYEGEVEVDCAGKYIVPGFIDAHLHLESTMVSPPALIHNALQAGTTTLIVDPHEAVNVAGELGLDYMLEQTENAGANVYMMLPSCVPASVYEDNGCDFTAERMRPYRDHPRVLGLGEVMDYISVINAAPQLLDKLALFENKVKDGHAPGLSEKEMAAYALADIRTDHECVDFEYARMEARNGMQVHIREGSGARNLEAIVSGIVKSGMDTASFSFCSDDKHIDDIQREGHISHNIKKSIALGIPTIKAYKMATINAARCYRLRHLGAVAPGCQADLVVLNNPEEVDIHSVYVAGQLVDPKRPIPYKPCPEALKNTVRFLPVTAERIAFPARETPQPVIEMVEGQIVTKKIEAVLPQENGRFLPNREYNKLVVVERHKNTGKIGIAPVKGFCMHGGAIATSVAHDAHNIIAVGDNDADILSAIEEIKRVQGGYVIVKNGKVAHTLPLPIMGLMSDADFAEVEQTLNRMLLTAHNMGVPAGIQPFTLLSFSALTVIPEIRLTAQGLFDVTTQAFLE